MQLRGGCRLWGKSGASVPLLTTAAFCFRRGRTGRGEGSQRIALRIVAISPLIILEYMCGGPIKKFGGGGGAGHQG